MKCPQLSDLFPKGFHNREDLRKSRIESEVKLRVTKGILRKFFTPSLENRDQGD